MLVKHKNLGCQKTLDFVTTKEPKTLFLSLAFRVESLWGFQSCSPLLNLTSQGVIVYLVLIQLSQVPQTILSSSFILQPI